MQSDLAVMQSGGQPGVMREGAEIVVIYGFLLLLRS